MDGRWSFTLTAGTKTSAISHIYLPPYHQDFIATFSVLAAASDSLAVASFSTGNEFLAFFVRTFVCRIHCSSRSHSAK